VKEQREEERKKEKERQERKGKRMRKQRRGRGLSLGEMVALLIKRENYRGRLT